MNRLNIAELVDCIVVDVVVTCDALLAPLPVPPELLGVLGGVLRLLVVQLLLPLLAPGRLLRALSLAPPVLSLLLLLLCFCLFPLNCLF